MSEQMWLVQVEFDPVAVTSDFDKGEQYLLEAFYEDFGLDPETTAPVMGIDLKLGDWCLTRNRVRQRGYHLRKIETL